MSCTVEDTWTGGTGEDVLRPLCRPDSYTRGPIRPPPSGTHVTDFTGFGGSMDEAVHGSCDDSVLDFGEW